MLIVANKFQTGFDEPRLVAMYVDKKLTGVATVQTLSRLNRIYPGKTAPMVVDFRNTPASVQADFKLYYSDAHVVGGRRPQRADTPSGSGSIRQGSTRTRRWTRSPTPSSRMPAVRRSQRPCHQSRTAGRVSGVRRCCPRTRLGRRTLESFRADVLGYRNAWQFLSQIVDYQDPELHRRAILATLLGAQSPR